MPDRAYRWQALGRAIDSDRHFDAADASVAPGSNTMTRYWVAARLADTRPGTNQYVCQKTSGATGWKLQLDNIGPQVLWSVRDASGTERGVEVDPPGLGVFAIGCAFDDSEARIRSWEGNTAAAASTGGYTASARVLAVNGEGSAQPLRDYVTIALLMTDSEARSDAEMQTDLATLLDNLRQGRDLDTALGMTPELYWDARDWRGPGTDWEDRVASTPLTPSGEPEFFSVAGAPS